MSRPLRIQFPDAVYHVMNRGRGRQPTFIDGADNQAFLDTLAEAHRLWGIEVFGYSLMGNHTISVLEHRKAISPGSCATWMAYIPSDLTDTIVVTGPCFGDATRQSLSMPMNI